MKTAEQIKELSCIDAVASDGEIIMLKCNNKYYYIAWDDVALVDSEDLTIKEYRLKEKLDK